MAETLPKPNTLSPPIPTLPCLYIAPEELRNSYKTYIDVASPHINNPTKRIRTDSLFFIKEKTPINDHSVTELNLINFSEAYAVLGVYIKLIKQTITIMRYPVMGSISLFSMTGLSRRRLRPIHIEITMNNKVKSTLLFKVGRAALNTLENKKAEKIT